MKLNKEKIENLTENYAVFVYDTIGSTNVEAREIAKQIDKNIIVCSEEQTQGKGRQGKSFYSPKNTGLYFSVVLPRSENTVNITCLTAVAVTRAIESLTDLKPQIKWVNDIYIDDKKVCGILVQAIENNKLVIGIGVNISTEIFPEEIGNSASSLNRDIDRNELLAEIIKNISALENIDFTDEYRKKSYVIGKPITYFENNIPHNATAIDIDEQCGLIVKEDDKTKTLTSGEITIKVKKMM